MSLNLAPNMSEQAIELIKKSEGCRLDAYRDAVGIWTIGWGHTNDVRPGSSVSPAEAERLLAEDICRAGASVRRAVKVPLNDNEFGALVALTFNIGGRTFSRSRLVRKLNNGDRAAAAAEFERFVHGRVGRKCVKLGGLVVRRRRERTLFETPIGYGNPDSCSYMTSRMAHTGQPAGMAVPPAQGWQVVNAAYPAAERRHAVPLAASNATDANESSARGHVKRLGRNALYSIGTGAALGAVPLNDVPGAQGLVQEVSKIWEQAGGPEMFPIETAWLNWAQPYGASAANLVHKVGLTGIVNDALVALNSHEGATVFLVGVALMLIRSGATNLMFRRARFA